jgi:hypothetical protein
VPDEGIVRAMMVVRANTMVYEAATPELTQMLLDLLNKTSRWACSRADRPARATSR